jgi:putative component of membrane protein insertase Oxa1/YidC/SpoIIIJ protein YidD
LIIKRFCLSLIVFYQRVLSPRKGFNCAHHQLNKGDTCSNAIKKILLEQPLRDIVKLSRARFRECRAASIQIASHRADIPCDIGCAGDAGCLGDSSNSGCGKNSDACTAPCDACLDYPRTTKRTKTIALCFFILLCTFLAYLYGSQITKLEITKLEISQRPNSKRSDSLFEKLLSRNNPKLRALAIIGGNKIYSNVVDSSDLTSGLKAGTTIVLAFPKALSLDQISRLELHDVRFSAAQGLVIVGQTLDSIDQPNESGNGQRFSYRFKSRWGI